jgi:uroporphyrinogen decarboxylase
VPITQLDCFKATVAHQKHEGFLFYAEFTSDLRKHLRQKFGIGEEVNLKEYFGMFNPAVVVPKPPINYIAPDFSRYYTDMEIPLNAKIDAFGVLHIPGSMYHFTQYVSPLRNAAKFADLESFIYPNIDGYIEDHMVDEVKTAHAQGKAATCWVGHMYEDSWQIRGYEDFLMDMLAQPEWCEYILDRVTERNKKVAIAGANAGVDFLFTGDDVANQRALMFSIDHWRRFMKPRWAEVFAAAKAINPDVQIKYHSDGDITSIIPELIEIGVTILNPIQPECLDLNMIKQNYGAKLVFDGSIGTQTTMPFGTPDDVRNVIRERAKTIGYDGALIFSPTHILEPEVPIQNIIAFVETAKEFGIVK